MQQIQAHLTDRLLAELPRFFGGRAQAFREIMQNAHRAGAKNLEWKLEGSTLTVQDDGRGCTDPQVLLSAGGTGWNEDIVKEPAGLGFFSLLHENVAKRVRVESSGWLVNLSPETVLKREPAVVLEGGVTQGTRITLELADELFVRQHIEVARGHYPMMVTFNGTDLPVNAWKPDIAVETSVGRVELAWGDGYVHDLRPVAVWEYRGVEGSAFSNALKRVKANPVQAAIAEVLRIRWFVNEECGVRPKLPDRNDLIQNKSLDDAARVVLDALEKLLLEQAELDQREWDEEIMFTDVPEWLCTQVGIQLMKRHGWHHINAVNWGDTAVYYVDNDGINTNEERVELYCRAPVFVDDWEAEQTINHLAASGEEYPWAVQKTGGSVVELVNHREGGQMVTLCDEIRVGDLKLPYLLSDESVVVAGTAAQAIRKIGETAAIIAYLANACGEGDWFDDSDDLNLNHEWARRDIVRAVAQTYESEGVKDLRVKLTQLDAFAEEVDKARRTLAWAKDREKGALGQLLTFDLIEAAFTDMKAQLKAETESVKQQLDDENEE